LDKLLIDTERAEEKLRLLWAEVGTKAAHGPLADVVTEPRLLDAIRSSMNSRTKTYVYVLPTQILAKLVQPKVDARCLQAKRGGTYREPIKPGDYSGWTRHQILMSEAKRLGYILYRGSSFEELRRVDFE